jgi:hypothetical protein
MQRRALLAMLGLPTNYYLTLTRPLPSTLLAATAVCLMPDVQAYQLLHAATSTALQHIDADGVVASSASHSLPVSASLAVNGEVKKLASSPSQVPGTVEVPEAHVLQEQGISTITSPPCRIMVRSHIYIHVQPSLNFNSDG